MYRTAALLALAAFPAVAAAQFTPVSQTRSVSYSWSSDTIPGVMGGVPTHMGGQDSRMASDFTQFSASLAGASQISTITDSMISGSGNAAGADASGIFGTSRIFSHSSGNSSFEETFDISEAIEVRLTGTLHCQSSFDNSGGPVVGLSLQPSGGAWSITPAFSQTTDVPIDVTTWLAPGRYTLAAGANPSPRVPTQGTANTSASYSFRLEIVPEPAMGPLILAGLIPFLAQRCRR